MNRSCTAVAVMILTLLAGSWLLGQEKKDPVVKGKGTLPANWSKLGLTEEQKSKIYAARAEYRVKIDALKQQIRDLEKEERLAMEKVLTDGQKTRLKEILIEKAPADTPKDDKKSDKKPSDDK